MNEGVVIGASNMHNYREQKQSVERAISKKVAAAIPALSEPIEGVLKSIANSRVLPSGLFKEGQYYSACVKVESKSGNLERGGVALQSCSQMAQTFSQALPALSEVEDNTPDKLEAEIKQLLSDKQRSGNPTVFTAEQVMKITNLACCKPEDCGYKVSQWSLSLLVKEIEKHGIADHISEKTVSCFLKRR